MKTLKPSGSKGFMTCVTKKDAAIAPKSQTEAQRKQVRFGKEEQQRKRTLTFEKKSEQAIQSLLRLGAAIQIRTGDLNLTKGDFAQKAQIKTIYFIQGGIRPAAVQSSTILRPQA